MYVTRGPRSSKARKISANSMLGLQVAFSPTGCSSIQISEDGKVKWNSIRYTLEDPASNIEGGRFRVSSKSLICKLVDHVSSDQYAAVLAALSVAVSSAASNQANYDDILAIARLFNQKRGMSLFSLSVVAYASPNGQNST